MFRHAANYTYEYKNRNPIGKIGNEHGIFKMKSIN